MPGQKQNGSIFSDHHAASFWTTRPKNNPKTGQKTGCFLCPPGGPISRPVYLNIVLAVQKMGPPGGRKYGPVFQPKMGPFSGLPPSVSKPKMKPFSGPCRQVPQGALLPQKTSKNILELCLLMFLQPCLVVRPLGARPERGCAHVCHPICGASACPTFSPSPARQPLGVAA